MRPTESPSSRTRSTLLRRPRWRHVMSSNAYSGSAKTVAELAFPHVERPLVSIVVLTYDDIEWVPCALQACLDNTDPCYELILVDNGSTDGTKEFLLEQVSGATVITNERNYG